MSRLRLALSVCGLCLFVTGCAGTIQAPKPARPVPEKSGFVPDTSPMPGSAAEWIDAANRKEAAAQFVVSMMYRDGMDGIENIVDVKDQHFTFIMKDLPHGCVSSDEHLTAKRQSRIDIAHCLLTIIIKYRDTAPGDDLIILSFIHICSKRDKF